jgi:hypothetical protein
MSAFMGNVLAWIEKNPDRFIFILLTVVAFIARRFAPGSRWGAIVTALGADLVKFACAILGRPMPGGFSPAPAVVPMTPEAAAKMPEPKPRGKSIPPVAGAMLVLVAVVAFAVVTVGCHPCPANAPPSTAEASAIVLRVQDATAATKSAMSSAKLSSVHAGRLEAHMSKLSLTPGSVWCDAAALYDELVALEQEVVSAGLPVPPQLTEAMLLVKWAVDRSTCECRVPAGGAGQ